MLHHTATPSRIVFALVAVSVGVAVLAPSGGAYAVANTQTLLPTAIATAIDTSGNTVLGQPDLVASAADAYLKSDDIYTGHVVATPLQVYGIGGKIRAIAFSPDAHHILVSGTVSALLYSAETYERERVFIDGTGPIAFSPDGTRILTCSGDNTAKLWDVSSTALIQTYAGHTDLLTCLAFSPDGTRVLTGSEDQTAKLWDTDTGELLQTFTEYAGTVNSVSFSPDGSEVLTSGGYDAKLWNPSTGSLLRTFTGHLGIVNAAVFSVDGTKVFTGSDDGTVKLSDIATAAVLRTFPVNTQEGGHLHPVESVAVSPDGTRFLTSSNGDPIGLWDIATGNLLQTFTDSTTGSSSVFSPDGSKILGETELNVRLWNVADPATPVTLARKTEEINLAALAPDGSKVFTGGSSYYATLWDAITGAQLQAFELSMLYYAAFSPDGAELLVAGNGSARLMDLSTGNVTRTFGDSGSSSAAFSPDGATVLTSLWRTTLHDGLLDLWDVSTGSLVISFLGFINAPESVAFSPDGTRVLASSDNAAYLWDISSPSPIQTFTGHTDDVASVAFSPDGTKVVTGSYDKTAQIWDAVTGTPLQTLAGHADGVYSVAFSPDGTKVLTGSLDGTAKIWDASTGTVLETFVGHRGDVRTVAFSGDGLKVLTSSQDGTARLWPTSDLVEPPVITQQPASVTVNQGQTASFTVASTNTTPPTYQWYKNDAALPGKTRAALTLAAAQPADAGSYACVITDETGATASDAATLTVQPGGEEAPGCFGAMIQPSSGRPGADALVMLGAAIGLMLVGLRWGRRPACRTVH